MRTSYFSGKLEKKSTRIALGFIFLVSQKFAIYKTLNTLNLFWFTIDSSVLLNEWVQFFFHDIYHFFVCMALQNQPDMIENSFRVSGITTNDPGKARNDEFLKKIMNSVKDKLAGEEEEDLEDEDPFSCV